MKHSHKIEKVIGKERQLHHISATKFYKWLWYSTWRRFTIRFGTEDTSSTIIGKVSSLDEALVDWPWELALGSTSIYRATLGDEAQDPAVGLTGLVSSCANFSLLVAMSKTNAVLFLLCIRKLAASMSLLPSWTASSNPNFDVRVTEDCGQRQRLLVCAHLCDVRMHDGYDGE